MDGYLDERDRWMGPAHPSIKFIQVSIHPIHPSNPSRYPSIQSIQVSIHPVCAGPFSEQMGPKCGRVARNQASQNPVPDPFPSKWAQIAGGLFQIKPPGTLCRNLGPKVMECCSFPSFPEFSTGSSGSSGSTGNGRDRAAQGPIPRAGGQDDGS